jgi:hypothetical protein
VHVAFALLRVLWVHPCRDARSAPATEALHHRVINLLEYQNTSCQYM